MGTTKKTPSIKKTSNTSLLRKPLTRSGQAILADEHYQLARVERPKVVNGITIAAAEGDRSENAEYIYGRKRLRELDKRLRYLDSLLRDAQIIDPQNLRGDRVAFGSTVSLLDEENLSKRWTIVGEGEADYRQSSISWKSPVGKALLGRKVGDLVSIVTPKGEVEYEIIDLHFGERSWKQTTP